MEKKFDKYKKRKTRIKRVSDKSYSFNPNYNSASPSQPVGFPIGQIKLENKSDYLNDIDIIITFLEDMTEMGFHVNSSVSVGRVGVSDYERGDVYKIKEFFDKTPSWSIGTINYNIRIESGKDARSRMKAIGKPDAFSIIKKEIDSLRGRLEDMTVCRVDTVSIKTENGYHEQYQNGGSVSTMSQVVNASVNITNVKSKRTNLEK